MATTFIRGHLGTSYKFKEVLEGKRNIPGFPGSTVHDDRHFAISCIVSGLLDSCSEIKPFNSLNLKVYPGYPDNIW